MVNFARNRTGESQRKHAPISEGVSHCKYVQHLMSISVLFLYKGRDAAEGMWRSEAFTD